jgi:hypothetical protein
LDVKSIYLNADEIKRLGYPDVLIRLLLGTLRALPQKQGRFPLRRRRTLAAQRAADLERLLDQAEERQISHHKSDRDTAEADVAVRARVIGTSAKAGTEHVEDTTSAFSENKLDSIERHLVDYKAAIVEGVGLAHCRHVAVLVDDFYLISPIVQPDVVDYLHRLLRGTAAYLKVGTVRHRTRLLRYDNGQTIGVEGSQDYEPIDLDQTFENVDSTRDYLAGMLDSMGQKVGVGCASEDYLSPEALLSLTLASGGVPRDYLNVFAEAVQSAQGVGSNPARWLTPRDIYKGAGRDSYRTKLRNFREDAGGDVAPLERVFEDLLSFCLRERRKTAFLISQTDAQGDPEGHELIQQLMDFKLIHVIEPDMSAASGRPGRYEAYTLDFSSFMEPRLRGIEIVEFWKRDQHRRPKGVREAPEYPLARARAAAENPVDADAETAVESLDRELGTELEETESGTTG